MNPSVAINPAPATAIDAAFPDSPLTETFPEAKRAADESYLFDTRRAALLVVFEDSTASSGYAAAVAFRRKDKKFENRWGWRPGWRLEYVILPHEITQHRLQRLLNAVEPPLLVEEEQLALDMFRAYAEMYWDMVPDLSGKWSEIHLDLRRRAVRLYPPRGWKPNPPRKRHAIHYGLSDPNSLCSLWLKRNGSADIPPQLELELRRHRRMMGG